MDPSAQLGSRWLLTGPPGSGRTQQALAWIRDAATRAGERGRGATPGRTLLVLPTYAQVEHVKRMALARWDARGLLDTPFSTFTGAGERFLPDFAVRALPSADERDRLVEAALEREDQPVFARVRDRAGFRARILGLIKELKQSGLPAADLRARLVARGDDLHPAARERLLAFGAVFATYEALLREAGMEDHEDTLRRLRDALHGAAAARLPELLVIDGFEDFTPIEEQILLTWCDRIEGAGGSVRITLPADPERPALYPATHALIARLTARGFQRKQLPGWRRSEGDALAHLATHLFRPVDLPPVPVVDGAQAVLQLASLDPADEADRVARWIRRRVTERAEMGTPALRGWRDVIVIARHVDDVASRFQAACDRHGVPLRVLGGGRPLAAMPLVRALRGLLPALLVEKSNRLAFDPPGMVRWLRWVGHATDDPALLDGIDRFEMGARENGWPRDLAAFGADTDDAVAVWWSRLREAQVQLQAAGDRPFHVLARCLPALLPLPEPSGLDPRGVPVDPAADRRVREARAALARLLRMLADFDRAGRRTGTPAPEALDDALQQWDEALRKGTFQLPDRRLDAVSLLDAERARSWEAPVVVVMGLAAGRFPRRPREDVILRDADRERLREGAEGVTLPQAREREEREARLFLAAVTRSRGQLLLSAPARDASGRLAAPSSYLRAVERVVQPTPVERAPWDHRFAPAPDSASSERDLLRWAGATRHEAIASQEARALAEEILGSAKPLQQRAARRVRALPDPLPLADAAVRRRFERSVAQVSPSRLRDARFCPYRFFLARVARVPQDNVPFGGPSADARREGLWMHTVLQRALAAPEHPAEAIADEVLGGEIVLDDAQRILHAQELARIVTLMRAREAGLATGFAPVAERLEWPLADGAGVDLDAAAGPFHLRGQVDRLDRRASTWVVVDYKRSLTAAKTGYLATKAGDDLQLPLYAVAVEALTGGRVVGLEWTAIQQPGRHGIYDEAHRAQLGDRSEGATHAWESPEAFRTLLETHRELAGGLVAAVRTGGHAKTPVDAKTCRECPYRSICRPQPDPQVDDEEGA